ncbi:unnamed protein product, partial [marine sediment metagenome]
LSFSDSYPFVLDGIFPSIIDKNAYVYLGYTNAIKKRTFTYTMGRPLGYNFPNLFLGNNKNKIYNNGGSKIFK